MRTKRQARSTKRLKNLKKQRGKYPLLLEKIIEVSDIVLEVLDARFSKEMQNKSIEKLIVNKGKKIIYVLNKSDLTRKRNQAFNTGIFVSCKNRKGITELRSKIKSMASGIRREKECDIVRVGVPKEGIPKEAQARTPNESGRIQVGVPPRLALGTRTPYGCEGIRVGVIGYPNTGKSSVINLLIGKASAKTGSEAGFTKGIQKLKLSEGIYLLDSPGVIPAEKYSMIDKEKIAQQVKVGGTSYNQVKNPELALNEIVKGNKKALEKFYKIKFDDAEDLIEIIGKKKGFLKKGGEVNSDWVSRAILKDWQLGNIDI